MDCIDCKMLGYQCRRCAVLDDRHRNVDTLRATVSRLERELASAKREGHEEALRAIRAAVPKLHESYMDEIVDAVRALAPSPVAPAGHECCPCCTAADSVLGMHSGLSISSSCRCTDKEQCDCKFCAALARARGAR
jgi:hypothetical protein